ncbi:MAG: S-methyl-5-thioribose-1-phosphate isomerase [Candidatus Diapherotrites archaeon]
MKQIAAKKLLRKTVSGIKSLKIQGASKVTEALLSTTKTIAEHSAEKNLKKFRKELREAVLLLANARPTEPEARAAAKVLLKTINGKAKNLKELGGQIAKACNNFSNERKKAMERIAKNALRFFPKKAVAFTHCHSHSVIEALKLAKKKGKLAEVYCTETRPLMQGHKTAKDLSAEGIKATLVVDSAAYSFLPRCDLFITGADAVTVKGGVLNKIGTAQISLAAKNFGVPHIVLASTHKIDPLTSKGKEPIEERGVKEVWEKKLPKLSIRNPAFDETPAKNVKAIVTEKGVWRGKR